MKEAGCSVVEADRPEELVEAIWVIQNGKKGNTAGKFFLEYFKNTENSNKYVDIITKINGR